MTLHEKPLSQGQLLYHCLLFFHLGLLCKGFLPRNLWFPAEKPMVSRQETFKTHAALKLQDLNRG
jgi:hypothetical protein